MTKIVPEVEPPKQHKAPMGECPRCSKPVTGFQIDAPALDDVTMTLKPCGCTAHSSDGHYKQFIDLVKGAGGLP